MSVQEMLNWTNDIPSGSLQIFKDVFKYHNSIRDILEIGCYHGTSMAKFLELLPQAKAMGIDIWDNDVQSELSGINFSEVERKFDSNVLPYIDRIEKRKGDSKLILGDLLRENRKFDLIYVDGSHKAFDALHDSILSWLLLNKNGIMVFDDYQWNIQMNPLDIPHHSINHFLSTYTNQYVFLNIGYRIFIQKTV